MSTSMQSSNAEPGGDRSVRIMKKINQNSLSYVLLFIEVNWNDFYNNMLMAGEVERIIVHAGVNRATVVLRRDAIYKGQRVRGNVFR